jgi:hypothetical protein
MKTMKFVSYSSGDLEVQGQGPPLMKALLVGRILQSPEAVLGITWQEGHIQETAFIIVFLLK